MSDLTAENAKSAEKTEKVLPCPFCGMDGVFYVKENDSSAYWVECAVCHAKGPRCDLDFMAKQFWNRRRPQMVPEDLTCELRHEFLNRRPEDTV